MQPLTGVVRPGKGQAQQGDEAAEPLGVGQMGLLEVKAAGFEATEEALDIPLTMPL